MLNLMRHTLVGIFSIALTILLIDIVSSQPYPNKPIRIFTSNIGGGSDFVSRQIAQGISGPLGQPVVIENRGGPIAAEQVSKAPPDGYSLLVNGGTFYILSLLQSTPYDPIRDFSPITITSSAPNILTVHPSLPVKSVKDLIALAAARPGELNYASAGIGTIAQLFGELFRSMANVNIVHIGYKGSAPTVTALLRGEVQLTFVDFEPVAPHIKSGRLKGIAVTSAQPSALFPGVPTISATVPGYEAISMTGVFAPAKTAAAIINRLNQEIVRFVKTPEAKERFLSSGVETVGNSPAELEAWMNADMARWGKVIKDAKIKIN